MINEKMLRKMLKRITMAFVNTLLKRLFHAVQF